MGSRPDASRLPTLTNSGTPAALPLPIEGQPRDSYKTIVGSKKNAEGKATGGV